MKRSLIKLLSIASILMLALSLQASETKALNDTHDGDQVKQKKAEAQSSQQADQASSQNGMLAQRTADLEDACKKCLSENSGLDTPEQILKDCKSATSDRARVVYGDPSFNPLCGGMKANEHGVDR